MALEKYRKRLFSVDGNDIKKISESGNLELDTYVYVEWYIDFGT